MHAWGELLEGLRALRGDRLEHGAVRKARGGGALLGAVRRPRRRAVRAARAKPLRQHPQRAEHPAVDRGEAVVVGAGVAPGPENGPGPGDQVSRRVRAPVFLRAPVEIQVGGGRRRGGILAVLAVIGPVRIGVIPAAAAGGAGGNGNNRSPCL